MKVKYEAIDGKLFNDKDKCEEYEAKIIIPLDIKEALVLLSKYCNSRECQKCPFFDSKEHRCSLANDDINPSSWGCIALDPKLHTIDN